MQLYIYSSQDLIAKGNITVSIKSGDIFRLQLDQEEDVCIYPSNSSGIMLINRQILIKAHHSQINFHKLSENALLCEINPFISQENGKRFYIKNSCLNLVESGECTYIFFNGTYCGNLKARLEEYKFDKLNGDKEEYGLFQLGKYKKYIILFSDDNIIYSGDCIDSETNKEYVQIYSHAPNIFNIGKLTKYTFLDKSIISRSVCDKGDERKQISQKFNIIYFLEAIKCERFKYAHSKLSYELKAVININTLQQYFNPFDKYIYLNEQDVYITIKNNKVAGVYHFVVKDNFIDNIY